MVGFFLACLFVWTMQHKKGERQRRCRNQFFPFYGTLLVLYRVNGVPRNLPPACVSDAYSVVRCWSALLCQYEYNSANLRIIRMRYRFRTKKKKDSFLSYFIETSSDLQHCCCYSTPRFLAFVWIRLPVLLGCVHLGLVSWILSNQRRSCSAYG